MLVIGWKGLNSGYGMKGMGRREKREKRGADVSREGTKEGEGRDRESLERERR